MKCDELKAHKAYNRWIDDEMPTPNDDLICNEVYLKSEADKVIADLEESHKMEVEQLLIEIAELQKQVHDYAQGLYVMQARAEMELRHQKYKRCLDQVENCRTSSVYFFHISESEKDEGKAAEYRRVSDWFDKWEERWMELAEKFKEAK